METQTDISMQDMKATEDRLASLEAKLEKKEELMRDMFVEKVTKSDTNVQKYLGVPSVLTLLGIFGKFSKHNWSVNLCMFIDFLLQHYLTE